MDGAGAGGAIDRVALNVMRDAGHDVVDVIRRMRSSRLGLIIECGERRVDLRWSDGFISASFRVTETASYSRGKLRPDSASEGLSTRGLRGKRARDVVDGPFLEGMIIASAEADCCKVSIDLEPRNHLFDAKTLEPRQDLFGM